MNNVIKTDKLKTFLEDCDTHTFEETKKLYFQDFGKDMSKDYIIGTIIENMVRREPCVDIYRIIHCNDVNSNDIDEILGLNYPFATSNMYTSRLPFLTMNMKRPSWP